MTQRVNSGSETGISLVVQLAFAGPRKLLAPETHPVVQAQDVEATILDQLTALLHHKLRSDLKLSDYHFVCGHSQLAVGADTIFARAMQGLGWPHRIFLPQNREDFLNAVSAKGTPDFNAEERRVAMAILSGSSVIQERVVSDSADRHLRFEDVNRELVRVSDVVVCLVTDTGSGGRGGTNDLIEEARRHERPTLLVHLAVDSSGTPSLRPEWQRLEQFKLPEAPPQLARVATAPGFPASMKDYCQSLKSYASQMSKTRQRVFRWAAVAVIAAHLVATGLAVTALLTHDSTYLPALLSGELVFLALGFSIHLYLHRPNATQDWALARLVAEIARSVGALDGTPGYLSHLFVLPLPPSLRPILRTLNVRHLAEVRGVTGQPFESRRNAYIASRLDSPKTGQISYYKRASAGAKRLLFFANWGFVLASLAAIAATLSKLTIITRYVHLAAAQHAMYEALLGSIAVILPIVAVGALSLAASLDLHGRAHTYSDMLKSITKQAENLRKASSERSFAALALETETLLLGETANWYSRRTYLR